MKLPYWSAIPLGLLCPILQLVIFYARFGGLELSILSESVIFLPLGVLSMLALIVLFNRARSRLHQGAIVGGYLLGVPFAVVGAMGGGLVMEPFLGTLVFGLPLLLVGLALGYILGGRFTDKPTQQS